jgi:hypothetical protein
MRPLRIRKIATTKFSSRGMIRMSNPAITDIIGEMWAGLRVMWNVSAMVQWENPNQGPQLNVDSGSGIAEV